MYYYKTSGGIIAVNHPMDAEEITAEEYTTLKSGIKIPIWTDEMQAVWEKTRPLTAEEVNAMLITAQINTLTVDDNTALRMVNFYPEWAANTTYEVGFKVQRNGKLWRSVQAHTAQDGWQPENTPSLWEQINETHTGELTDPIPYEGNMALENGKHYIQNGAIYLCIRDTVNPVYNSLADLVGLYVEVI